MEIHETCQVCEIFAFLHFLSPFDDAVRAHRCTHRTPPSQCQGQTPPLVNPSHCRRLLTTTNHRSLAAMPTSTHFATSHCYAALLSSRTGTGNSSGMHYCAAMCRGVCNRTSTFYLRFCNKIGLGRCGNGTCSSLASFSLTNILMMNVRALRLVPYITAPIEILIFYLGLLL